MHPFLFKHIPYSRRASARKTRIRICSGNSAFEIETIIRSFSTSASVDLDTKPQSHHTYARIEMSNMNDMFVTLYEEDFP